MRGLVGTREVIRTAIIYFSDIQVIFIIDLRYQGRQDTKVFFVLVRDMTSCKIKQVAPGPRFSDQNIVFYQGFCRSSATMMQKHNVLRFNALAKRIHACQVLAGRK